MPKICRPWSTKDNEFLCATDLHVTEIAKKLGRTETSIRCHMNKLGISVRRGTLTKRELERKLGYSYSKIERVIAELGIRPKTYTKSNRPHTWLSKEQVQLIQDYIFIPRYDHPVRKFVCSVPECEEFVHGRGVCSSHYRKFYLTYRAVADGRRSYTKESEYLIYDYLKRCGSVCDRGASVRCARRQRIACAISSKLFAKDPNPRQLRKSNPRRRQHDCCVG